MKKYAHEKILMDIQLFKIGECIDRVHNIRIHEVPGAIDKLLIKNLFVTFAVTLCRL